MQLLAELSDDPETKAGATKRAEDSLLAFLFLFTDFQLEWGMEYNQGRQDTDSNLSAETQIK